ncbi:Malonyl CoA-acyl carrier protein transacylase [Richelia intracellularis HH01]|uniref:Malonyl CoA-acyl carrier protein transacylase n=1 Tax=Richelia intracellularis HH01 TaxID=1165094 RepID=M1X0G7_9NOST|nr:ACP S-malonyltransferase [Richelia intracellularis]CCH67508.1 Malonyl CoA-acyl carrier protein transacylase [Richelia intracellularis HH01]HAE05675.1 [acyl-carrier-protein] S-malonyltransferase [Richelia sp.]
MTKTAWVFPGQGSQNQGMGDDLRAHPLAKEKFAWAKNILGWSLIDICHNKPDKLLETLYTQPCLYIVETILADLIRQKQQPDLVAGHSLGEYVALYVAGVFEWSTGLQLVKSRAELMNSASGGMMAALIKFDRKQLENAIANNPEVFLANDNSPNQVVISGTPKAVKLVISQVKSKRTIPLKVSGAFHSNIMKPASQKFKDILTSVEFLDANIPVLSNTEPTPSVSAKILKQRLMKQMTSVVRWREIALALPEEGVEKVIEIGPGNVLTGLIKRTCPNLILENIQSISDIEN